MKSPWALLFRFWRWHAWDANQRLIAASAVGITLLLLWAALAPVDEITRGMGKVIRTKVVTYGLRMDLTNQV